MLPLSSAYKELKDAWGNSSGKEGYNSRVNSSAALTRFICLFGLQIVIAIYAIYCLNKCRNIPTWTSMLLTVSFFVPDLGFFMSLGVIVYYLTSCQ